MLLPNFEELADLRKQAYPPGSEHGRKTESATMGDHASPFKGRGLDFSEFREYSPGDDIRAIDWRVTARTGRPHTKKFTEERERVVYIIVDTNAYMEFGTRNTFKSVQAARIAASLAWVSNHFHNRTGAILFGRHPEGIKVLAAKSSRKSIWEMLKLLCSRPSEHAEVPLEDVLYQARQTIPQGSQVFIVSDFFQVSDEAYWRLTVLARRCEITLVKVSDPAEESLPALSRVRFADDQGPPAEVDTNDSMGGKRYREAWKAGEESLKTLCHNLRMTLLNVSTKGEANREVLRYLFSRRRRKSV